MLIAPAVILMLLVAGFPILYALWLSLHRADLRFPQLDKFIGLDNYISVLKSHTWWRDVRNTVIITFFSVALELALGMLIAQAMYRALYARTWIRVAVLVPYGAVTVVSAFAWSLAFNPATGFAHAVAGSQNASPDDSHRFAHDDHPGRRLEDDAVHLVAVAGRPGARP